MRYVVIGLWLIGVSFSLHAQDYTYTIQGDRGQAAIDPAAMPKAPLYVVPFDDHLFKCQFTKPILGANPSLTYEGLRDSVRLALVQSVAEACSTWQQAALAPNRLHPEFRDRQWKDVHGTMQYSFRVLVPPPEEETGKKKLLPRKSKPKPEPKAGRGGRIENGQVVTDRTSSPKYLHASFKSNDVLGILQEWHETEYLILINEVDIVYPKTLRQEDIQAERFTREWQVHYSVYSASGKSIGGGLITANSASDMDDWESLKTSVIPELAERLAGEVARWAGWQLPEPAEGSEAK